MHFFCKKDKNSVVREVAQLGRALGLGPRGRRFESCLPDLKFRGLSSAGRAPALHAGGQRFDPARLHCNLVANELCSLKTGYCLIETFK